MSNDTFGVAPVVRRLRNYPIESGLERLVQIVCFRRLVWLKTEDVTEVKMRAAVLGEGEGVNRSSCGFLRKVCSVDDPLESQRTFFWKPGIGADRQHRNLCVPNQFFCRRAEDKPFNAEL